MVTKDDTVDTFWQLIERANTIASQVLCYDHGGFTHQDVTAAFMEKHVKQGDSQSEIESLMSSPMIYRLLKNQKNDLYRNEAAIKRGNGVPTTPIDEVEFCCGSNDDNPEMILIEKQTAAEKSDFLRKLFKDCELSETQLQILQFNMQGYKSEEIAIMLATNVETVYSRHSEAIRKLQKALKRIPGK